MATRWEVERAVLWSSLESSARLLVLALLTKADVETAVIPAEHSPSLTTLQQMTGLSLSSVKDWLNALEDAGWVKRTRRLRGRDADRTTYALLIGAQTATKRKRDVSEFGRPPGGLGRQMADPPRPPGGRGVGRQVAKGRPPDGQAPTIKPQPKQQPKPTRRSIADAERRDDVEKVCEHLADRIEANGSQRPTVTDAWRTSARLLIDKDHRTVDQIIKAIDWCQDDDFWRANVLSMPKLRAKYDQLRLAAQRGTGRPTGHRPYTNPADISAYHGEL
jgi:DNA-binding PadR family transcriptional regulator